jgi:hypothetical protein
VKLNTRLQRLEQRVGDPGCLACRDRRGRHVLINALKLPDDTLTYPNNDHPLPCEQCGLVPEFVIAVVQKVVKSRADLAGLEAQRWSGAT